MLANRMPQQGRIALTPMLNSEGKLIGDFTVAKLAADRFFIIGSGIAENYHMRWCEQHLPAQRRGDPRLRRRAGRAVGRRAEIARAAAAAGHATTCRPPPSPSCRSAAWRSGWCRRWSAASASPAISATRSGSSRSTSARSTTRCSRPAQDLGIRHFGARALQSLRLEKSFGTWAREYRPIYGPYEAGLDRFIDLRKNDFIGRDAAAKEKQNGPARKLVTLVVDATDADTIGDEPVWHDDKVVGWITSGGYAHYSGKSIALGYVPAGVNGSGKFEVEILGERRPARLSAKPVFDPDGTRMRG